MKTFKVMFGIIGLCALSLIWVTISGSIRLDMKDAKWQWIQSKIYDTPRQTIDYVFVGSSRTWCAVRSQQLEDGLNVDQVWNFGRHWTGRDMDYVIIRALLQRHDVKQLMIETIGQEKYTPHIYAKYVMLPDDMWSEAWYHLNGLTWRDILGYSDPLKQRLKHVFGYVAELSVRAFRIPWVRWIYRLSSDAELESEIKANDQTGGFYVNDQHLNQRVDFKEKFANFQPMYPVWKSKVLLPRDSFADFYLQRIAETSQAHGTQVNFVFISDYASVLLSDQMFRRLREFGPVYVPNLADIYRMEYWRDQNHLYQNGAVEMTRQMEVLIRNGPLSSQSGKQYER